MKWTNCITGKDEYRYAAKFSSRRQDNEQAKFEKARDLKSNLNRVRARINKGEDAAYVEKGIALATSRSGYA